MSAVRISSARYEMPLTSIPGWARSRTARTQFTEANDRSNRTPSRWSRMKLRVLPSRPPRASARRPRCGRSRWPTASATRPAPAALARPDLKCPGHEPHPAPVRPLPRLPNVPPAARYSPFGAGSTDSGGGLEVPGAWRPEGSSANRGRFWSVVGVSSPRVRGQGTTYSSAG